MIHAFPTGEPRVPNESVTGSNDSNLLYIFAALCLVYYLCFDAFRSINEYSLIDRFVEKDNKVFCDALQE